jgi:alcohol dehydrogenase class IV
MSYGAMLAGLAINNTGTTSVHAMGYALSVLKDIPHGLANALVLPVVMRFNAEENPDLFASLFDVIKPANDLKSISEKSDGFVDELFLTLSVDFVNPAQKGQIWPKKRAFCHHYL